MGKLHRLSFLTVTPGIASGCNPITTLTFALNTISKSMQFKTILLLAPHPDDGEFSCGATLKRWSGEGAEIWYAAFSPCKKSVPEGFDEDVLYKELPRALSHLGIPDNRIVTFDYPVREFPAHRQSILDDLIQLRQRIKPDLVLMPNSQDIHQDHKTIHEEGVRAFKFASMLGYELPWNTFNFPTNGHVKVDRAHLDAKINALKEYRTQQFRPYMDPEFLVGLARTRGLQVNADYAEAFEVIRWVM